jgi:hypothetical protein
MERLVEKPEINYHTFAALTGDGLTQVYNKNKTTSCEYCVSGYLKNDNVIFNDANTRISKKIKDKKLTNIENMLKNN